MRAISTTSIQRESLQNPSAKSFSRNILRARSTESIFCRSRPKPTSPNHNRMRILPSVIKKKCGGRGDAPASPPMLHRLGKLRRRQSIEHVDFRQPGPPRLQNAVTDLLHVRSMVRVGVDDDFHALLLGLPQMNVVQVQAVGI